MVGDDDRERTFGAFFEEWAFGFMVLMGVVGELELHVSRADDLEAVVEIGAGSKVLGAEACARVVHFEECDGLGGVVAYGRCYVGRVAAGGAQQSKECKGGVVAHER